MKVTYLWSSDPTRKPFTHDCNVGAEAVPGLLEQLKVSGHDVELVNTSTMLEKDRIEFYTRASWPAVCKHYEIKKILGTSRRSACWFGAEVPTLLVTDDAGMPGDTYPHRKGNQIATIHDFLTRLVRSSQ